VTENCGANLHDCGNGDQQVSKQTPVPLLERQPLKSPSLKKQISHFELYALLVLLFLMLPACYEEKVGPELEPAGEASNACLNLAENTAGEATPDGILAVFDCLNSEGSYNPLRSPLEYLIYTEFTEALSQLPMGYLDPYFIILGYLDPLNLEENVQSGDLVQTIESLEAVINDPDEPIRALLDLYIELYQNGHLYDGLTLSQAYAAYFYSTCSLDECPLLELGLDIRDLDAYQVLQENSATIDALMDPELTSDIQNETIEIAYATSSASTSDGENLLFGLVEAFTITPLADDPERTVDDPYIGKTLLEAIQKPLCQLLSDRRSDEDLAENPSAPDETVEAFMAGTTQSYLTGQLDYMPLHLRTLVNYNPGGAAATVTSPDTRDIDGDGYSIAEGDCHDDDITIYPGADEILDDMKDNDCDLVPDNPVSPQQEYKADYICDRNGDGQADALCPAEPLDIYDPDCDSDCDGVSPNQGDCNDTDPFIHPYVKIYGSDGSIAVVQAAEELLDGVADFKDNDCDGFTDHIPSSLELVLRMATEALPMVYAEAEDGKTTLEVMLETLASQPNPLDIEALLTANEELIDATIYNLSNGTLDPDLTAQVRVLLPVIYKLADLGLLNPDSMGAMLAIADDHEAYQFKLQAAVDGNNTSEQQLFDQRVDSCGVDFEDYVDTAKVLTELVQIIDAYNLLEEPHLLSLIPIVVNSDLLIFNTEVTKLSLDEEGELDPDVIQAQLAMFDYFLKPPEDSGAYSANYPAARLWALIPLVEVLFEDPVRVQKIDELMIYAIGAMEDPSSVLAAIPDALNSLSTMDTGGSTNTQAIVEALLTTQGGRRVLLNAVAIFADPNLPHILAGAWESLPEDVRDQYEVDRSAFDILASYIENGTVDSFLDLAGTILAWIVDNSTIGDPEPVQSPEEGSPTDPIDSL